MKEILSFSEIKERFDSEWVFIGNPETKGDLNIKRGTQPCGTVRIEMKCIERRERCIQIILLFYIRINYPTIWWLYCEIYI